MSPERDLSTWLLETLGTIDDVTVRSKALRPDDARGIAFTISGAGDEDRPSIARFTVNLRCRGIETPNDDVDAIADAARVLLHGAHGVEINDSVVAQMRRTSWVSLGQTDTRRWERSDNYLTVLSVPAALNL